MKQIELNKKRSVFFLTKPYNIIVVLVSFLLLTSCNTLRTAVYDQYSYQKSIDIKVEASNLMDNAIEPYADNLSEIEALHLEIEKIVAYEKNKPNNEITYAMWQILSNEDKNLLSGFFKRWKEKGQMSQFFITEAKGQIMESMDLLIQYEGKKDKGVENKLLAIIRNN